MTDEKVCSICAREVDDNAPLLAIGSQGYPRLLCDECAAELDTATIGRDYSEIVAAMDKIGKKLAEKKPDELTLDTVNGLMSKAATRAKLIDLGEYDFSLDETDEGESESIPEELLASVDEEEEDEKEEEEDAGKLGLVKMIIMALLLALSLGFIIYKFLGGFLF